MRLYNKWAGNPKGVPEDPARCIAGVWNQFMPGFPQCSNRRGKGPHGRYCGTHANALLRYAHVYVPKDEPDKNLDSPAVRGVASAPRSPQEQARSAGRRASQPTRAPQTPLRRRG